MRRTFYFGIAIVLAAVYVQIVLEGPQGDRVAPPPTVGGRPAGDAAGEAPPVPQLTPDPEARSALPPWDAGWEGELLPGRDSLADARLGDAARAAWAFIERNYSPATGLVRAHDEYRIVTMWDVASTLAAYHAAARLGLADPEVARARTARALRTLGEAPLFDGALFNKVYDAETGQPVDAESAPSENGYGWSAIDMGRLLLWLRILREGEPELAPLVDSVVTRLEPDRAVDDGYLRGRERGPVRGVHSYQEGRIGYEQYAARGFEAWGVDAGAAGDLFANVVVDSVHGRPVPRDARGTDCLTSEPLVLAGMEIGWDEAWGEVARATLEAQHARYVDTGQVTIVSEDASSTPPHYFYYYCVSGDGEPFPVRAKGEGELLDGPRAVSTKAALAWYALAPSPYTALAVATVAGGVDASGGWPAGVLEGSGAASGVENVNTAGVVLEAALYARDKRPFLTSRPSLERP
ncbi:MAG TPA: DUF3131 domain-containing protein [Longimicrobiales bacterium]|nr:DUF3131 domain-containing protein [Longimicrobiales bacterium]